MHSLVLGPRQVRPEKRKATNSFPWIPNISRTLNCLFEGSLTRRNKTIKVLLVKLLAYLCGIKAQAVLGSSQSKHQIQNFELTFQLRSTKIWTRNVESDLSNHWSSTTEPFLLIRERQCLEKLWVIKAIANAQTIQLKVVLLWALWFYTLYSCQAGVFPPCESFFFHVNMINEHTISFQG